MVKCVSWFLAAICCASGLASEPISVSKLEVSQSRDRLAKLLHVYQSSIELTAERPFRSATLRLDFYRDGTKVESRDSVSVIHTEPQTSAAISLQIADLDFLPLADGAKDSMRFLAEIEVSGEGVPFRGSQTLDISKQECDITTINGSGQFTVREPIDGVVPLCWMLSLDSRKKNKTISGGRDPAALLRNNPAADILIVSIALTEAKAASAK